MIKQPWNPVLHPGPWSRWFIYSLLFIVVIYMLGQRFLFAGPTNGFDLGDSMVPVDEIEHGGPARDGIPAIDKPHFINADKVTFLEKNDRVLGIDRNGIQKAYPIKILNYHEIVNDTFNDEFIIVSYCPLCGTGMAFLAPVEEKVDNFGVSGLLYKSDVLLYDRKTESLWSQIMKQAISGPLRGKKLKQIAMSHTSWGDWRKRFPATRVLSTKTGSIRNYDRSPYAGYETSTDLYFSVGRIDTRYHPKELVIGLTLDGVNKAYPFVELARTGSELLDVVASQKLQIQFDAANRTGRIFSENGDELPTTIAFWFAWHAFHPDTDVYTAP